MTKLELPDEIVSVHWLAAHLNHPQLILLDASLAKTVNTVSHSLNSYHKEWQIPGTRLFDFDKKICDRESSLPHMMPSPELFTYEVQALGVCKNSVIVVFDKQGIYSSPRAWWMFKAMGHEQVAVLNGGLPAWIAAGLSCHVNDDQLNSTGDFIARPQSELICDMQRVEEALEDKNCVVMDARSELRFRGKEPEPRTNLQSGHMPNAQNLPFTSVLNEEGYIKNIAELREIFAKKASYDPTLIFTCGSGVTSCILALAARLAGYSRISVYDGSWSEWGHNDSGRAVVL